MTELHGPQLAEASCNGLQGPSLLQPSVTKLHGSWFGGGPLRHCFKACLLLEHTCDKVPACHVLEPSGDKVTRPFIGVGPCGKFTWPVNGGGPLRQI